MLTYFFILVIPLLAGVAYPSERQPRPVGLWFFFVVLLVFCGLRFEVGADWGGYLNIFDITQQSSLGDAISTAEPSFYLLNWVADWSGVGFAGVIFVSSLIFLYGCFRYARVTFNPWLAIAVVVPYLVFIISLSGIRQACAIGIGFVMLADWQKASTTRNVLLIALAASFHNSAVVLMLFPVLSMRRPLYVRLLLAIGIGLATAAGLDSSSAEKYRSVYLENDLISEGAFYHVMLTAFPGALYLHFRRKLAAANALDPNVFLGSILTLCALPLLLISSTGVDRLTLYFSFVQMWTYPALLRARVMNRTSLKTAVAVIVLTIFIVYFQFGSHAYTYVPYRNLLWSD